MIVLSKNPFAGCSVLDHPYYYVPHSTLYFDPVYCKRYAHKRCNMPLIKYTNDWLNKATGEERYSQIIKPAAHPIYSDSILQK
jgi:hypothetical protein